MTVNAFQNTTWFEYILFFFWLLCTCGSVLMCKRLSDTLPIQSGLRRVNAETLLPSSFALEYTSKELQANQEGLKLDWML